MTHERENVIENYLRHHLVELGLKCIKFIPDHANGMPDRLILMPDRRVPWVELKTDNGKLAEVQRYQHTVLENLGQEVVVVWNREQADELIDRLEREFL